MVGAQGDVHTEHAFYAATNPLPEKRVSYGGQHA